MKRELVFANKSGEESFAPVLDPLLPVLLPAFLANAEGVHIQLARLPQTHLSGFYCKDGQSFPLKFEPGFPWASVFSVIKIKTGMSIMPESHQLGEMAVLFENKVISLSVETTENDQGETLDLKVRSK